MTVIVGTILSTVATKVAAATPQGVDSTAPASFVEWDAPALESAECRNFEVQVTGLGEYGNTGISGSTGARRDGFVKFLVRIKYIDLGGNARGNDAVIAADVQGLIDVVQRQVREAGGGVTSCDLDGEAFMERTVNGEQSLIIANIPFRCEYRDTQVTS